MALLATKRLLTKDEIFSTVAGYSGNQESMERMFERDKDDLRKLGIEIEVEPVDPFFEDELGYRISPQKYSLEIPDFSPAELALLSLAGQSWRNQALSNQSQRGLRKLESMGIDLDEEVLSTHIVALDSVAIDFDLLWEAVLERRILKFAYETTELTHRTLRPYGLTLFKGEWYVAGLDNDRGALRTFKVRRMKSISTLGKASAFEVPQDFNISTLFSRGESEYNLTVLLRIRRDRALGLRKKATFEKSSGDWDEFSCSFINENEALREILWHGDSVQCLEPSSLVSKIVDLLTVRSKKVSNG